MGASHDLPIDKCGLESTSYDLIVVPAGQNLILSFCMIKAFPYKGEAFAAMMAPESINSPVHILQMDR